MTRSEGAIWESDDVRAGGVRLRYHRTGGDGPPLVLAHGITDDGRCWTPLAREFAGDYDVVAYDARGHGRSGAPASGYAAADRVADLAGLLDALDLRDPVLVGHSMGGNTVGRLAAARPDLPRAVVLEDPAGLLHAPGDAGADEEAVRAHRERFAAWSERSLDELRAELGDHGPWTDHLARARRLLSPHAAEIYRHGFPHPRDAFPEVARPTLVLRADVPPAERERDRAAVAALADGRLVHVEGAGHTIRRDAFEETVSRIRAFLDEAT